MDSLEKPKLKAGGSVESLRSSLSGQSSMSTPPLPLPLPLSLFVTSLLKCEAVDVLLVFLNSCNTVSGEGHSWNEGGSFETTFSVLL